MGLRLGPTSLRIQRSLYSTIAVSDFSGGSAQPVGAATQPNNPYGNSTAPQFAFSSSGWTLLQAALTSAGPIDVRGGSVRVTLCPIANTFNLSQFNLKLFSTTSVSSPGSNYHQIAMSSRVGQQWTGKASRSDLLRLAKALFDQEESILPENEAWERVSQSYYDKCAMAMVDELMAILKKRNH